MTEFNYYWASGCPADGLGDIGMSNKINTSELINYYIFTPQLFFFILALFYYNQDFHIFVFY